MRSYRGLCIVSSKGEEVKSMENNKWERFIEILISPEIALLLAVLAVLMNLYLIYLNHIDSYML